MLWMDTGPAAAPERFIEDWLQTGRRDVAALVRTDGRKPEPAKEVRRLLAANGCLRRSARTSNGAARAGHIPQESERWLPKAGLGRQSAFPTRFGQGPRVLSARTREPAPRAVPQHGQVPRAAALPQQGDGRRKSMNSAGRLSRPRHNLGRPTLPAFDIN